MSERPTVTEVVAKLNAHGSADQLAAFFEQEGVTGLRRETFSCPIARYTAARIGCTVSASMAYVYNTADPDTDQHVVASVDEVIVKFMERFDDGAYPALQGPTC